MAVSSASSSRSALLALARPLLASASSTASSASSSRSIASTAYSSAAPSPSNVPSTASPQHLSFSPHTPLPRTHGIHVATLHLASHHPHPLDLYSSFAVRCAGSLGIPTSNPAFLPTTTSLYTVLKSPFVHKKSQENFERRTHRRVIKVWDTDRSVVDLWLRYLKRNGIGGVGMKAYVHEFEEFGFGSKEIADLAKQMERPGQDVEQIAEELVQSLSADAAAAAAAATESQGKIEGSTAPAGGEGEVVTDLQGKELVEGPDDVVAGAELPAAHPESEAAEKPKSQPPLKDGGEPAKS